LRYANAKEDTVPSWILCQRQLCTCPGKTWYCPLIEKLMLEYPISEDRARYFQHFKGNKYKLVHVAFDSETQERIVVYQALYGDRKYWVRPEKMFFETIERDGKRFSRFTEIDWEE